ncbi:hypothetical protein CVT25_013427 [Psilocybe cyanescens]|uniref:Uncharacterized protein n=1 Tax=Psilocybe cyanescens TaxID=93625 RepID=A0A409WSP4_PSICY|nr:hypothetical protein CVT25_013427 [Psilocybe cyanescens]
MPQRMTLRIASHLQQSFVGETTAANEQGIEAPGRINTLTSSSQVIRRAQHAGTLLPLLAPKAQDAKEDVRRRCAPP